MTVKDLKEMDIVLRRDGAVLWILKNGFTNEMQTFTPDLWGQHVLSKYDEDFAFNGYERQKMSRSERERFIPYDIVAVDICKHNIMAMSKMRKYVEAKRFGDKEEFLNCFNAFHWTPLMNVDLRKVYQKGM